MSHPHIPPDATDYIPNIESEVKILPDIIRIIRYSCNIKYCCHSV